MTRLAPWPVVAVGALVWKDGRLLLVRRGRPPRQGCWSIPGGRQEAGETVAEAVVREIREEAGIAIRVIGLVAVVDLIDHDAAGLAYHYTVIDLLAEWENGELQAGDDAEEAAWVDPAALDDYQLPEMQHHVIALAQKKRNAGLPSLQTTTVLS